MTNGIKFNLALPVLTFFYDQQIFEDHAKKLYKEKPEKKEDKKTEEKKPCH